MRSYDFYVLSLSVITGLLVVSTLGYGDPPSVGTFIFWTLLVLVVNLLPVSLGFGTEVTMGIPIDLALAILFPPWVAMAIVGLGSIDDRELRRRISLRRAAFNRVQLMLSVGVASMAVSANRDLVFTDGQITILPISLAVIALAVALHVLVNLGLVSFAVALDSRTTFWSALRELIPTPAAGFWVSHVLLSALGVVTALAYEEFGGWAVAAMLIPVLFARLSLIGARTQQELSERVQKQQEALLTATEKVFQERENERQRIAADIHDSSLQLLAAATYGLGNASEFLDVGKRDPARDAITNAREAVDHAIKDLRASLVDLRRSSVEEGGLMETVRKFADQMSTVWGAEVAIKGNIDNEPPIPVSLAAFQILQESLINAMKHARGSTVTVAIEDRDGLVHIVIEDDGPGFNPEAEVGADHVGMRLMNERAARVGGRIELKSSPGAGTRLEAILPGGVSQ